MAYVSELASATAELRGMDQETAALVRRYLREAGLVTTGALGRNAPRATNRDARNLLLATCGMGTAVRNAPDAVKTYGELVCHQAVGSSAPTGGGHREFTEIESPALQFLARQREAKLGDVMESIIERFIGGELPAFVINQGFTFLSPDFLEKAQKQFGDDKEALATHVMQAAENLVLLGVVRFQLSFYRPLPTAELLIDRVDGKGGRDTLAIMTFRPENPEQYLKLYPHVDGGDCSTIGYRTFKKIADVLAQ